MSSIVAVEGRIGASLTSGVKGAVAEADSVSGEGGAGLPKDGGAGLPKGGGAGLPKGGGAGLPSIDD